MSANIEIRPATARDLDRIVEIENLSFSGDGFSRRQFAYLVSHARGAFYVAVSDGETAGYVSLLEHSGRRNLRIYAIAVHPGHRGKKIAQALIDKAVRYAGQRGLKTLSLEVRMDNSAALGLYEKNGFTVESVKKGYYSDGSGAYRMWKDL